MAQDAKDKIEIVVIEDDLTQRQLMEVVLSAEGWAVHCASNGEDGLLLVRKVRPSLVVTDVMMPVLTGWDVCLALRRDPETASIPLIFVTARAAEADYLSGFSLGADDYITKPYLPQELVKRVRTVLARAGYPVASRSAEHRSASAAVRRMAAPDPEVLLAGQLSAASLIEVLQTLGWNAVSGLLEIHSGESCGRVELRRGHVVGAEVITPRRRLSGFKAWLRLAGWTEGNFELRDSDEEVELNIADRPIDSLILEAAFDRDEYQRLRDAFPPEGLLLLQRGRLSLESEAIDLRVWQAATHGIELDALLDELEFTDVDILRSVVRLLSQKVIGGKVPRRVD